MKRKKYTDEQICGILKQVELGVAVEEVCRKFGVSNATFYRWKEKYGGLMPSEVKRLRLLEEENQNLKKLVAELALDKAMLQEVVSKKL